MAGVTRPMSKMSKLETKEALFRARKRILRYLVHSFLRQEGFLRSAETFASEAALTGEYEVCDNIDLDIILQDYCNYYLIRFNKTPQFCKKVEETQPVRRPKTRKAKRTETVDCQVAEKEKEPADLPASVTVTKLCKLFSTTAVRAAGVRERNTFTARTARTARAARLASRTQPEAQTEPQDDNLPIALEKPLAGFLANSTPDKRQLAEMLYQDIIRPSGVSWNDVKGLKAAKELLAESVVYPVRYDIFKEDA